jgi:hypothetical protein
VYLIFALIDCLTSSPTTGAEDSDDIAAEREADRQYAALNSAEAVVPLFAGAVRQILCDHAAWVSERELRDGKAEAVLLLVLSIFLGIPFEACPSHPSKG